MFSAFILASAYRGYFIKSTELCMISIFLCFQGDRFGGALDNAAKQFSEAYDSGMIPMEFVNSMRKKGKLIMGIGHRVKSVSVC